MHTPKPKKIQGFTLIETLVAVLILSVTVAAGFNAATSGLRTLNEARDRTTAFFLAQEGIEVIKNIRDTNSIEGQLWNEGFGPCVSPNTCAVDGVAGTVATCSGTGCNLTLTPSGLFSPTGTVATRFARKVQIQNISNIEVRVSAEVSWGVGTAQSLTVTEYIYDRR